jgi:hypothetical protein
MGICECCEPHHALVDLTPRRPAPVPPWRLTFRACCVPQIFRASPKRSGERVARPKTAEYGGRWKRFARQYRQTNPFCAVCMESRRLTFAALVDHKMPVADGGPMYPGSAGVWSLCTSHHAWKSQLENLARRTGQMDRIVEWCDRPDARPKFRGQI